MNTPQRFLILWIIGAVLSTWIVQSSFKNFPKLYRVLSIPLLQSEISKIENTHSPLQLDSWLQRYATLIQKQSEDLHQIEIHMQGNFAELTQSLQDLPTGLLVSADLHKETHSLVLDLILKKP